MLADEVSGRGSGRSARSSRGRPHGRPLRTASAPTRRSAVTSFLKVRAQPGERGYPGRLRRRDHTSHSGIIAP
jgi:hypothetical protein